MDSERFDGLARAFSQARSRRQTLGGLAGFAVAGTFPQVGGRQLRPPSPLMPSAVVGVSARAARASGTANVRRMGSSPASAAAAAPGPTARPVSRVATEPASGIAPRRPCALRATPCCATR